ncbi:hypothetical protein T10_10245 [Trichinella papuae]|uniref:Uncharacterized protein n=1 Tax=Trichinella papuae TaxID=268474 RepID=A0A0V1MB89_9BILA|nr:hypothetical protein T10_2468 [Trichinella papuae]KRZ78235.1 hypothetical protein T10_10245 [Trichinella papuae]
MNDHFEPLSNRQQASTLLPSGPWNLLYGWKENSFSRRHLSNGHLCRRSALLLMTTSTRRVIGVSEEQEGPHLVTEPSKQSRASLNAPLTFKFSHSTRQGGEARRDLRRKMGFLISLLLAGLLSLRKHLSDSLLFPTVEANLIGTVSESLSISPAFATDLCTSCSMDPYAAPFWQHRC